MAVKIFDIIVAVLIASMVMGGLGFYYADFSRNYNANLSDSQFDTFNRINDIVNLSEEQGGAIVGADIDKEAESVTNFFVGSFNAAKRVLTSPFNMAQVGAAMINDVSTVMASLGISKVFQFGILALLTVIITFGLIVAVLKVRP